MGSFNATCAVSKLPIRHGEAVRLIMLVRRAKRSGRNSNPASMVLQNGVWGAASLAIPGVYDGAGAVKDIDPQDWRARFFLDCLKREIHPVKKGENPYHDHACNADVLTDMAQVQKLVLAGDGRVRIKVHKHFEDDGHLPIAFMLVHESVYTALSEEMDGIDGPCRVEPAVAAAKPLYEAAGEAVSRGKRLTVEDFVATEGAGIYNSFYTNESGTLHCYGQPIGGPDYLDLLGALAHSGVAFEEPKVQKILAQMAEFAIFDGNLAYANQFYSPQPFCGDDADCTIQVKIAKLVLDRA